MSQPLISSQNTRIDMCLTKNNNKYTYRPSDFSVVLVKTSSIDVSWIVGYTITISRVPTSCLATSEATSLFVAAPSRPLDSLQFLFISNGYDEIVSCTSATNPSPVVDRILESNVGNSPFNKWTQATSIAISSIGTSNPNYFLKQKIVACSLVKNLQT